MSTPDGGSSSGNDTASAGPSTGEVPAELRGTALDPAVLTRLVNEIFRAPPGAPNAPTPPASLPTEPAAGAGLLTSNAPPTLGALPVTSAALPPGSGASAPTTVPSSVPAASTPTLAPTSAPFDAPRPAFPGAPSIGGAGASPTDQGAPWLAPRSAALPWLAEVAPGRTGALGAAIPTLSPLFAIGGGGLTTDAAPTGPPASGRLLAGPPQATPAGLPGPTSGPSGGAEPPTSLAALPTLSPIVPGLAVVSTGPVLRAHGASTSTSSTPGHVAPPSGSPVAPRTVDAPPTGGPGHFGEDTRAPGGGTRTEQAASPRLESIDPRVVPDLDVGAGTFDVASVRRDFPILEERVHGVPLVWLDNAATTQKPRAVIERISEFYERENSNIHRAAHTLAARSTDAYEGAREKVRRFLHASSTKEIAFVRGTTEGMNLLAKAWGGRHVGPGDEIVLTTLEHHSNIVPWQMLAQEKGAKIKVAPVDDDGQILLHEYEKLFTKRTRIASVTHVSNALGTITPVKAMVEIAHRHGARIVVDGAQSVSHIPIDVQAIGCDFFVFSGHKVFGPTGIGVVWGKPDALDEMPPWQGGGNMIVDVTFEKTVYAGVPARFEAGTGNIADAVGLGAALDYVERLGMSNVERYEHDLLVYATGLLSTVPGLRPVGTAKEKASVLSFVLDGYRSEEVGALLDREGIAVRAGHHCAQPALRRFGLETSVRPSLALYNTKGEVDHLVATLRRIAAARGHRRG